MPSLSPVSYSIAIKGNAVTQDGTVFAIFSKTSLLS
jgi:hypothetical protein